MPEAKPKEMKLIMPILEENKGRYPKNWKQIRRDILARADNKCEFCGVENYTIKPTGAKVVLTIAHLDHTPENCDYSNLRALCQKCHNTYDAEHRKKTRILTKEKLKELRSKRNTDGTYLCRGCFEERMRVGEIQ